MTRAMTQVVIVGAGPTGLTLGLLLVRSGIAVKVIESSNSFRRIFRGEALMPSGLEAIAKMGLSDILTQIPRRNIDAWQLYIENRPIFRVDEPMEPQGQPCTLISQAAFLGAVSDKAQEYENFELIQGQVVRDLCWENDRAVGVQLNNGETIAADLVIGADGRNSILRQKAGLTLNQDAQNFDIVWLKMPTNPEFKENIFYSIVRDRDAFGVFQSSEGNLQVGWSMHTDDPIDWQNLDWSEKLALAAPEFLSQHFRSQKGAIEKPMLLSIVVGRVNQWSKPGLLLLGDAAHPMSPIRAQGINMALRDSWVAAQYLTSIDNLNATDIDILLPQIQAAREPEIIETQRLQQAEIAQAKLMRNLPPLRHLVSILAPVMGSKIRYSWLQRQLKLRRGVSS